MAEGRAWRRRVFDAALLALVVFFVAGWGYGINVAIDEGITPRWVRQLTFNPLPSLVAESGPPASFLLNVAFEEFAEGDGVYRGKSGAVRVVIQSAGEPLPLPDSLGGGVAVEYRTLDAEPETGNMRSDSRSDDSRDERETPPSHTRPTPSGPGTWGVLLRTPDTTGSVTNLHVLAQVPLSRKSDDRIGEYVLGEWPFESGGTPPTPAYETPRGLVAVTPENRDVQVSEHLTLGDFLTKGQTDVWPKYVALSVKLLDKIELTVQQLEAMGHPVENIGIISGFRTPYYNRAGGDPSGRGSLSRHMYGDALDFYIDNNRDSRMDDLNGSGEADIGDARVIADAVNAVENEYPELVGGMGLYGPTGGHAGFVHVDTRGERARW